MIKDIVQTLKEQGKTIATAESCTGGLLAATITSVPGSSAVFHESFVTYSNTAKIQRLGVESALLAEHGAVSKAVALAMATGLQKTTGADLNTSITGIAGPGGGSAEKPVGTVWIGLAHQETQKTTAWHFQFKGDRDAVRQQSVDQALLCVRECLKLCVS